MNTTFSRLLLTKTPLSAALLALLLAGCASTQSNFASKGVLLDDGSYYFPAQDGQGDYYHAGPQRTAAPTFLFAYGHGPFWPYDRCQWSSWYCRGGPWAFGHAHPFDIHFGWIQPGHPYVPVQRPPRQPGWADSFPGGWPGRGQPIERLRANHGQDGDGPASLPGRAGRDRGEDRESIQRERIRDRGFRDPERAKSSTVRGSDPGNVRIRERNHDQGG